MSTPTSFASTVLINPPNASPILTVDQVWKGLGIKARDPKAFVPMISECKIVSDVEGGKLVRQVRFGDGPFVTEEIESFDKTIVYFEMSTGTRITNLISYLSPSNDLLLTFTFAGSIPGVAPGSTPTTEELSERIGGGVRHSVEVIRGLVRDGVVV